MNFKRNEKVNKIYLLLSKGFLEWSAHVTKTKTFVIDHLAGFFHYKKREYTTFEEMIKSK